MRMMLLTAGTRGDVEPFAALARRALSRGHQVRLALPDDAVAPDGVDTVRLGLDAHRVLFPVRRTPRVLAHHLRTEVRPAMRRMLAAAVRESVDFGPGVVVHHPLILSAPMVADALGVPRVLVEFAPVATPSERFPAAGGPTATRDLGPRNRSTYAVPRAVARLFDADVVRAAAELPGGRRPARRSPSRATLMAVSPALLPRPDDWPERVHQTGAWYEATPSASLDPEVGDFLRAGRFIVASFGSMATGTARDAAARGSAIVTAARSHGLRVLLVTGAGGLALPAALRGPDVLAVGSTPFDAVLPGATLALHHGGAGTAHAVARAGVPAVVVPVTADQPFWAAQLHRQGVAAAPVPLRRLSVGTLEPAMRDALTRRDRAADVGRRMRAEHGVERALDVLEAL
ncbi:glycosyltransferase family 1 protein [Curtobacterium sp. VKM Ac-2889]|uniref:glycosyltransferase n=1 Tax=Curtobacterium TaxID=2034 RepID=UPI00188D99EB|nr:MULTISPECIES: glycosyltransferase [Curtobacterium]MBF4597881.1 glycosyltransferase family 1 protein [Curtobacterium sp. VKM Ac-1796]MBF4612113.1 glycosyltransferase family 1 protein [Curtobacterium sp. VKM Ac-2889]MBT1620056.1 glycosyltransferase [Curtobacterium flaccumfaciens pv. poinsettiae]MCS6575578.1 glycosyltransferase [Curtobacterium flaccumfaciens pv. flaccumfaciens]UXZ59092.1 glycosyltransferase [Curtobacterium sp. Arg-1]